MKTLHAPVSEETEAKVHERLKRAGFQTVAEYVRSLIREDLQRGEDDQLLALLLEDTGDASPEERLAALRAQIQAGLVQLEAGKVIDGPTAIARTRERLARHTRAR